MIKLIASDMDGTLLSTHTAIDPETAKIVKEAQEMGIEFLVATGRNRGEALPALENAGIHCKIIGVNGAQTYDEQGNTLKLHPLDKKVTHALLDILEENKIYVELGTTEGIFSESQEKRLETFAQHLLETNPHLDYEIAREMAKNNLSFFPIKYVKSIRKEVERKDIEVLKLFCLLVEEYDSFDPVIQKIKEEKLEVTLTSSGSNNLEINHVNAQKGIALKELVEEKGLTPSEVMAIGDSFNDISMLEYAGVSFAMGNANDTVKSIAKYVTTRNTENGVGKAIRKAIEEER